MSAANDVRSRNSSDHLVLLASVIRALESAPVGGGRWGAMSGWLAEQMKNPKFRAAYACEDLIIEVTEGIALAMEKRGMTKAQLARKIKRTPAFVTQILNGRQNLTLATIAMVMNALDYKLRITAEIR